MTAIMTAEAERAISDHQNKPLDDLQKIDATMAIHRERRKDEVRRMQTRFERWLPVLLSSRAGRVARQLERSIPMGLCRQFIAEHFEEIVAQRSALDRFLDGELTAGAKPIYISKMNAVDVGHLQETARIIDAMAAKLDAGEWAPKIAIAPEPEPVVAEFSGLEVVESDAVEPGKVLLIPAQTPQQIQRQIESLEESAPAVTPAQQAKLDSKVSALPPAMPRHPRRRR